MNIIVRKVVEFLFLQKNYHNNVVVYIRFVFLRLESISIFPVSRSVVPCPFTFGELNSVFEASFFRFPTLFTSYRLILHLS